MKAELLADHVEEMPGIGLENIHFLTGEAGGYRIRLTNSFHFSFNVFSFSSLEALVVIFQD